MKKWVAIILAINVLFIIWQWFYPYSMSTPLNIFCQSTLKIDNDKETSNFFFDGTLIVRFKPDTTGYIGLTGIAKHQGYTYNVSREMVFNWQHKDNNGIYAITPTSLFSTQNDNAPDDIIEQNITGKKSQVTSYIIRRTNNNTYSIGNIYTPIAMCVDKA